MSAPLVEARHQGSRQVREPQWSRASRALSRCHHPLAYLCHVYVPSQPYLFFGRRSTSLLNLRPLPQAASATCSKHLPNPFRSIYWSNKHATRSKHAHISRQAVASAIASILPPTHYANDSNSAPPLFSTNRANCRQWSGNSANKCPHCPLTASLHYISALHICTTYFCAVSADQLNTPWALPAGHRQPRPLTMDSGPCLPNPAKPAPCLHITRSASPIGVRTTVVIACGASSGFRHAVCYRRRCCAVCQHEGCDILNMTHACESTRH